MNHREILYQQQHRKYQKAIANCPEIRSIAHRIEQLEEFRIWTIDKATGVTEVRYPPEVEELRTNFLNSIQYLKLAHYKRIFDTEPTLFGEMPTGLRH